jgi:hypothetical protein
LYPDITEEQNWNDVVFELYTGFQLRTKGMETMLADLFVQPIITLERADK